MEYKLRYELHPMIQNICVLLNERAVKSCDKAVIKSTKLS